MAAVAVQIRGTLYDLTRRTSQQVLLQGEASLLGLEIGGGPIIPPGGGEQPPLGIWGPPTMPPGYWGGGMGPGVKPQPPGTAGGPPVDPGYGVPIERPEHPIYYPPNVPPALQPPNPPNPGDPTTPVPPPEGSPGWPVQPIQPPAYIVVNYPGIGPVTVAMPLTAQPKA